MTGAEIIEWRERLALSQIAAARRLGCDVKTLRGYERDRQAIPKAVALACRAIEAGLRLTGD